MSDLFRIPIPPELATAGVCTLARLSHEAEETDDDVLLLQVAGVMQARPYAEQQIYREAYLAQWKTRMDARKQPNLTETKHGS